MDLFTLLGKIVVENKDALQNINDVTDSAASLGNELESTSEKADTASTNLGSSGKIGLSSIWLGNMFTILTTKATNLFKQIAGEGIEYNAAIETLTTSFATKMGGDSEKAEELIGKIRDLASTTPLGLSGLAENANMLMGFGIEADDVVDTLRMLGDAAQGDQGKLNSIALAYGQINGAAKMNAQDANQLISAGVPIWQLLADSMGQTIQSVKQMSESGDISFDDVTNALKGATTEGGMYYQAMESQSKTFNGQMSTLKDNAEQTIGSLFQPFYDALKSDVLPKLAESLQSLTTWISDNKDTVAEISTAIANLASNAIDGLISALKWMMENGEAVGTALTFIGAGIAAGAIAAHPYAAAILVIASALALLKKESQGLETGANYDKFFDGYDNDQLQTLQAYVDAVNAAREAEKAYADSGYSDDSLGQAWADAQDKQAAAFNAANAIDGLISTYNAWRNGQAENQGQDLYLDVPLKVDENAESEIQSGIDGMSLDGVVKLYADLTDFPTVGEVTSVSLNPPVRQNAAGAVFSKPTIFDTRLGGQMVGEAGAEAVAPIDVLQGYVASAVASQTAGLAERFDAMLGLMREYMPQLAQGNGGQVVLDSGALVGQIIPQIDYQLGKYGGGSR